MTITAAPLAVTRRNAAVSASAWFHTTDPGVFAVDYPDGISGPATVTAAGTRVWRNGLKQGQYLARANCLQARDTFALFAEIDTRSIPRTNTYTNNTYTNIDIIGSVRANAARRWNWCLQVLQSSGLNASRPWYIWHYLQSNTSSATESLLSSAQYFYTLNATIRLIMTCDGTAINFYWSTGTTADSAHPTGRTAPTGTMGGNEFFFIAVPGKFAKLEGSLPSQAQREAFMSSGTLPAGLAASYQGGHEINPAAPVFYDTSGNGLDLSDVDVDYWPEAAASGDFTDTGFTSPLVEVPITIAADCTAGVHDITLRRTRVGIPARTPPLPDAVLYDDGVIPVTVEDLPEEWIAVGPNQRTRLANARVLWPIRVRSSADGEFTATAEPADGLTISGPFVITGGACDFTAQPTKAGTWILTVTQDGRTDSVTLEALAPAAAPTVRQYNLSAEIDGFFDFINRKYGLRPRFTASSVQDVRAEHATDRTYSRYAQGTGQPGSVFGAVALSYQVMISYSSAVMAEQDLGILREEADRYGWNAIGFSMTGQTMFEPIKMMPRLTLTLNFDIIPQGR